MSKLNLTCSAILALAIGAMVAVPSHATLISFVALGLAAIAAAVLPYDEL